MLHQHAIDRAGPLGLIRRGVISLLHDFVPREKPIEASGVLRCRLETHPTGDEHEKQDFDSSRSPRTYGFTTW